MRNELTRERLQTGLHGSLLLFQPLACSPESFIELGNVHGRELGDLSPRRADPNTALKHVWSQPRANCRVPH